jgi:hypothetical protein
MEYHVGMPPEGQVPLVQYLSRTRRRTVTALRLISAGLLAARRGPGGLWVDRDELEEALAAHGHEVDRAAADRRGTPPL